MPVFELSIKESVSITENIKVVIAGIRGGYVRIGIEAPREINIRRSELKPHKTMQPQAPVLTTEVS